MQYIVGPCIAICATPIDFGLWDEFAKQHPDDFVREGEAIRRREQQIVKQHIEHAVSVQFDGHEGLAVNATVLFSEIAGTLAEGRAFGAAWFERSDGKRQWSLRSRDGGADVSVIAKARGGGGHPQAAGFQV